MDALSWITWGVSGIVSPWLQLNHFPKEPNQIKPRYQEWSQTHRSRDRRCTQSPKAEASCWSIRPDPSPPSFSRALQQHFHQPHWKPWPYWTAPSPTHTHNSHQDQQSQAAECCNIQLAQCAPMSCNIQRAQCAPMSCDSIVTNRMQIGGNSTAHQTSRQSRTPEPCSSHTATEVSKWVTTSARLMDLPNRAITKSEEIARLRPWHQLVDTMTTSFSWYHPSQPDLMKSLAIMENYPVQDQHQTARAMLPSNSSSNDWHCFLPSLTPQPMPKAGKWPLSAIHIASPAARSSSSWGCASATETRALRSVAASTRAPATDRNHDLLPLTPDTHWALANKGKRFWNWFLRSLPRSSRFVENYEALFGPTYKSNLGITVGWTLLEDPLGNKNPARTLVEDAFGWLIVLMRCKI